MNIENGAYCELKSTGQYFNDKEVYECQYCKMKLGLENPDTKILCFKKMQDFTVSVKKLHNPDYSAPIEVNSIDAMQDVVLSEVIKKYGKNNTEQKSDPANLCSQEQIKQRIAVCEKCEHYKDSSCLLCGCVVVREINHMNKLAHKDQKCPIEKWGVITD
jgi:hypothetical protein